MKIFSAPQIREIDAYTIQNEPIASIDLMERASVAFVDWLLDKFPNPKSIKIFAGIGNNGGDGLAVGRILQDSYKDKVSIYAVRFSEKSSADFQINEKRLGALHTINQVSDFPECNEEDLIIDAIFGSGLSRPISGFTAQLIEKINGSGAAIVAIDIASGLFCNSFNDSPYIIKPNYTISFQFPKLSFLLPQNEEFVGTWQQVAIGLHPQVIADMPTPYYYVNRAVIQQLIKKRAKFSHKGTFGHVLLIAGSYGKIGAAILAGKAALRSGAGLVTVHLPTCGYSIMQVAVPEIMCSIDKDEQHISSLPDLKKYSTIAIGPGIGKADKTLSAFTNLLRQSAKPLIIDADALNLLSEHQELFQQLPQNSILTPHPKEFERLVGKTANHYERLEILQAFSQQHQIIVVLKGAHTAIALPDGNVYFNSTGNPGMATAGSGDVLTGIIASLLGQGYLPKAAAIFGVYLHGLAGDQARDQLGEASMLASDMIDYIGHAFQALHH